MESDLLQKLQEFPSPFFWDLNESMYENVHEKLSKWTCSDADRLACKNALAFLSYARDNDSLQARRQFQEVLDEDPENLVALTSLAYIDVKHSDVASAETKRRALAELKESGGETEVQKRWAATMFDKSFCLTRFGQWRYKEAQLCIEEALKFDSDNKEWLKAETFLLTKQVESQALARVSYGEIQTSLDRAAANVLKLQQMEPGSGEVLCMTAELFEAAGRTSQGGAWMKVYKRRNPDESLDPSVLYQQAYALCPTNQHICHKAVLHLKGAREWEKMEAILTKALKDFPNDHLLYHQYGLRYFIPYEDAVAEAKKAKGNAHKEAEASAKVKMTSAFLPKTEEYLRKGVKIDPIFTRCRICLAQCLFCQDKVEESWQQFRIASEKTRHTRNKVEAKREWAKLLIKNGNESGALMQLREALTFEGQTGIPVYRGLDNALDSWRKLDRHDPRPIRVRAAFALEAGNEDNAIEYYKQALKIDADDIRSLIGLGKACRKKGKEHFEEAKKWLEKASGLGCDEADDELTELELEMLQMEEQSGATSPPRENLEYGTPESPHTFEDELSD
ncbi:Hypp1023 [Branchiostoma lanceolatum]|uniref:Hypp1023 protein n=1 Tax=Branchiostoma lanceolatum TaxID=7740 RepID=A0A8J9ZGS9_BRALA|nr:Hypp1023 [Branchiostoma lanceolatum]